MVLIPVSEVDRAKGSYSEQIGFVVNVATQIDDEMRLVQLTPPGSTCSIHLSTGILDTPPGVLEGLQLVIPEVDAARAKILERGVEISDIEPFDGRDWKSGGTGEWSGFAFFSDLDGNGWVLQERPAHD